jgi:hypothetical protein
MATLNCDSKRNTALHGLVGPLVPRLLGADRESLVVVMEWLAGPTVEEVIRGTDRHDAERRLVAYARAIGLSTRKAGTLSRKLPRLGRSVASLRVTSGPPLRATLMARR